MSWKAWSWALSESLLLSVYGLCSLTPSLLTDGETWHILWDAVTAKFKEVLPKWVSESSRWLPGPLSPLRGGSTHYPHCSWQWCSGVCRPGSSKPSLTAKKKTKNKKPPRCHCTQVQDFRPGPHKPKPPNAFKNNFTDEMRITSSNFITEILTTGNRTILRPPPSFSKSWGIYWVCQRPQSQM